VTCEESLDIRIVAQLHQKLMNVLAENRDVRMDGAAVEKADTAALQVLAAFFKDAAARGLIVKWENPSEPLRNAADLLGLSDVLALGLQN
jgi:ABC-type transporter Mla MlaB component